MKLKEIRKQLGASQVSKNKKGNYVARFGFFYKMGKDTNKIVAQVKERMPNVEIIDSGEVYLPFKGGAPVSKQSHWYVEFNF